MEPCDKKAGRLSPHSPRASVREGGHSRAAEPVHHDVDFGTANQWARPQAVRCHCPAVSRIGGLTWRGACASCPTPATPSARCRSRWRPTRCRARRPRQALIGINQNAPNRYVELLLREGAFCAIPALLARCAARCPWATSGASIFVNDDLYWK